MLVWIALAAVVDFAGSLAWYPYWSPAGNALLGVADRAMVEAPLAAAGASGAQEAAAALRAQQIAVDLHPWLAPHLGLAAIGLASAVVASIAFRRFRGLS